MDLRDRKDVIWFLVPCRGWGRGSKRSILSPSLSFLTWVILDGDASHCSGGLEGRDITSGLDDLKHLWDFQLGLLVIRHGGSEGVRLAGEG